MILVTYNLRSGGKGRVHWTRVLEEFRPDLFLVQETVAPEEHLPPILHGDLPHRVAWRSVQGRHWGSAVYVARGTARTIELPDFHGHVVGVEVIGVRRPGKGKRPLRAFSIHAPIRGSYHRAMNQILDMIADHARDGDIVIGGDLNVTAGERHPLEARTTSVADRAILGRLGDEFGLANCWQEANPDKPLAQTLRWSNAPAVPYHCDGLFVPRSWLPSLHSCEVVASPDWDGRSDHNPIVARFQAPRSEEP
jgi:endonuclease/exonuclease/phosphatase family metal-dependent hydrolase